MRLWIENEWFVENACSKVYGHIEYFNEGERNESQKSIIKSTDLLVKLLYDAGLEQSRYEALKKFEEGLQKPNFDFSNYSKISKITLEEFDINSQGMFTYRVSAHFGQPPFLSLCTRVLIFKNQLRQI